MRDVYAVAQTAHDDSPWMGEVPLILPEPWVREALCTQVDPDLFWPVKKGDGYTHAAKKVCTACPVAAQCLEYALRNNEMEGVWGNTSPKERAAIRRLKEGRA